MPAAPGAVNAPQPNIPTPTIPTQTLPAAPTTQSVPGVVAGGYVMPMGGAQVQQQPLQAVAQVPTAIAVQQPVPTAPAIAPVVPKAPKPATSLQPPIIPNLQPTVDVAPSEPAYIPAGDLPE